MKKLSMQSVKNVVFEFMSEQMTPDDKKQLKSDLMFCTEIHEIEFIMNEHGYEEPASIILELIVDEIK